MLYIAFGIVWVVIIVYTLNLIQQQRQLNKEYDKEHPEL